MPARSEINQDLCQQHGIDYEAVVGYQTKVAIYKGERRGTPTEHEKAEIVRFRHVRYLHDKSMKGANMHKERQSGSRSLESSYQYKVKHGLTETITDEERQAHTEYFRKMMERNPDVIEQRRKAQDEYKLRMNSDPEKLQKQRDRRNRLNEKKKDDPAYIEQRKQIRKRHYEKKKAAQQADQEAVPDKDSER